MLHWAKMVFENCPQNAFSFNCLNKTKDITPLKIATPTKKTIQRCNSHNNSNIKKVLHDDLFANLT